MVGRGAYPQNGAPKGGPPTNITFRKTVIVAQFAAASATKKNEFTTMTICGLYCKSFTAVKEYFSLHHNHNVLLAKAKLARTVVSEYRPLS